MGENKIPDNERLKELSSELKEDALNTISIWAKERIKNDLPGALNKIVKAPRSFVDYLGEKNEKEIDEIVNKFIDTCTSKGERDMELAVKAVLEYLEVSENAINFILETAKEGLKKAKEKTDNE